MATTPSLTRAAAAVIGILWCYIQPSINFIGICFIALILDCYTAWRCNRRIYSKYRDAIKKNPKCNMDGKLRSCKMAKMVQDFSVLILAIFLATLIEKNLLAHLAPLYLANYLSAIYCVVQFISILENESTCNGAAWARVLQKIVADKTERHLNVKLKELMQDEEELQQARQQDKNITKEDTDNDNE